MLLRPTLLNLSRVLSAAFRDSYESLSESVSLLFCFMMALPGSTLAPPSPFSLFYLTSVSCVQLEVSTASRVAVGAFGLGSGGLGRPLELRLFGFGLFICINYLRCITSIKINKINEALATKSD